MPAGADIDPHCGIQRDATHVHAHIHVHVLHQCRGPNMLKRIDAATQKAFDSVAHALMRQGQGVTKRQLRWACWSPVLIGEVGMCAVFAKNQAVIGATAYAILAAMSYRSARSDDYHDAEAEKAGMLSKADRTDRFNDVLKVYSVIGISLVGVSVYAVGYSPLDLFLTIFLTGFLLLTYLRGTKPIPPKQWEKKLVRSFG